MKKIFIASALFLSLPFTSLAYTIDASAGAGATISPAGSVTVAPGANQAFAIGAQSGQHVTDVSVDGSSVGKTDSYEFDNVSADHSIAVTAASNLSGGLLPCSGPMAYGWNVSLPNGGCPLPPAPVYLPTMTVKNADGSYTFGIVL